MAMDGFDDEMLSRDVWQTMGMYASLSERARYFARKFIENYYNMERKPRNGNLVFQFDGSKGGDYGNDYERRKGHTS